MTNYIEYLLDDGSSIMIEGEEHTGIIKAALGAPESGTVKLDFKQAFANARSSIRQVIAEFDGLHVDEAEIKFGLKAVGEAGIFAIGKVGGELNYEVTLHWKKPAAQK